LLNKRTENREQRAENGDYTIKLLVLHGRKIKSTLVLRLGIEVLQIWNDSKEQAIIRPWHRMSRVFTIAFGVLGCE
jgi:hypothetical protein